MSLLSVVVKAARGNSVPNLDCLATAPQNTRFLLNQSPALIRRLRPKRALPVGLSCGSFVEHNKIIALFVTGTFGLGGKQHDSRGVEFKFAKGGYVPKLDL